MADKKIRILLVDDEPNIVKMVAMRLEYEGFEVIVARDGEEAIKMAQGQEPDLIILDVMLPKLSGFEVCRWLKKDLRYQKIPIVMLTARAQESDEEFGYECGTDAYLRKPFRAQELLETIRSFTTP